MGTISPKPSTRKLTGVLQQLHSVKFGRNGPLESVRIGRRDLNHIVQMLAVLLENGLSLPKSLETLTRERSMVRHRRVISAIRRRIEAGESLSVAMEQFPRTFSQLMVQQIKVGERTGTVVHQLKRLHAQLEQQGKLRSRLIKKISYPALVILAGLGLVIFMMTVVVPQFEEVYAESEVPLPWVTRVVMEASEATLGFGWMLLPLIAALAIALFQFRRNEQLALRVDQMIIHLPIVGNWFRDLAVLQFMEALGIMMESGFVPADAIDVAMGSTGNRAVRQAVGQLRDAVHRGERLSSELAKHPDMFPATVSQLVVVGEKTGNLSKATGGVRKHLQQLVESRVDVAVGAIEPVLTLSLAVIIGFVILAIYMPMFGMFDAMDM